MHALDLKGFGKNKGMQYPYSLDDYCAEVKEYIDKNGLSPVSVIAHSFGGRIAIRLASKNPQTFDKIVLTGSAGLKPKRSFAYRLKRLKFFFAKRVLPPEKLIKYYSSDYRALDGVMRESFKKIVGEYLDGEINKIKNPTLIIFGEKDSETPVYMAKRLNRGINDSKMVIIKDAGHFAFIDNPVKFNWEVKEFLLR